MDMLGFKEAVIFVNIGTIVATGSFRFDPVATVASDSDPDDDAVASDDFSPGFAPNQWTPSNDEAMYWRSFTIRETPARYLRPSYLEQTAAGKVCVIAVLLESNSANPPSGAAGVVPTNFSAPSFEV
jgi:hypothetical protein